MTELPPFRFASSHTFAPNPIDPRMQFSFQVPTTATVLDAIPASRSQTAAGAPWPVSDSTL